MPSAAFHRAEDAPAFRCRGSVRVSEVRVPPVTAIRQWRELKTPRPTNPLRPHLTSSQHPTIHPPLILTIKARVRQKSSEGHVCRMPRGPNHRGSGSRRLSMTLQRRFVGRRYLLREYLGPPRDSPRLMRPSRRVTRRNVSISQVPMTRASSSLPALDLDREKVLFVSARERERYRDDSHDREMCRDAIAYTPRLLVIDTFPLDAGLSRLMGYAPRNRARDTIDPAQLLTKLLSAITWTSTISRSAKISGILLDRVECLISFRIYLVGRPGSPDAVPICKALNSGIQLSKFNSDIPG